MTHPRAFLEEEKFAAAVRKVEQQLGRHVLRIRHTVDEDSTGDPAVHFRIVLPDESVRREKILEAARYVSYEIERNLQPQVRWGVNPYFLYRSKSEQETIQEPAWA